MVEFEDAEFSHGGDEKATNGAEQFSSNELSVGVVLVEFVLMKITLSWFVDVEQTLHSEEEATPKTKVVSEMFDKEKAMRSKSRWNVRWYLDVVMVDE